MTHHSHLQSIQARVIILLMGTKWSEKRGHKRIERGGGEDTKGDERTGKEKIGLGAEGRRWTFTT